MGIVNRLGTPGVRPGRPSFQAIDFLHRLTAPRYHPPARASSSSVAVPRPTCLRIVSKSVTKSALRRIRDRKGDVWGCTLALASETLEIKASGVRSKGREGRPRRQELSTR